MSLPPIKQAPQQAKNAVGAASGEAAAIDTMSDRNVKRKERPNGTQLYTLKGMTDRPKPNRSSTAPLVTGEGKKGTTSSMTTPGTGAGGKMAIKGTAAAGKRQGNTNQPKKLVSLEQGFGEYISSGNQASLSLGQSSGAFSKDISLWKSTLETEQGRYNSVSTWAEVMLRKVTTETKKLPNPNPLRTSVVMMIMSRILPLCAPYDQLLQELLNESLSAMYIDWEDYTKDRVAQTGGWAGSSDMITEYDESCPVEVQDQATVVSSLKRRQTFFEAHEHLQNQRIKILGKPAKVLSRAVSLWRRKILRIHFALWKADAKVNKLRRSRVMERATWRHLQSNKACIESHFNAFRTYVFERRHQCRVVYEEKSRVKLVHRMGRRIKQLERENARISEQYDILTGQHWEVATKLKQMDHLWIEWKRKVELAGKVETPKANEGEAGANTKDGGKSGLDESARQGTDQFDIGTEDDDEGAEPGTRKNRTGSAGDPDFNTASILQVKDGAYIPRSQRKSMGTAQAQKQVDEAKAVVGGIPESRMGQLKDFLGLSDPPDVPVAGGGEAGAVVNFDGEGTTRPKIKIEVPDGHPVASGGEHSDGSPTSPGSPDKLAATGRPQNVDDAVKKAQERMEVRHKLDNEIQEYDDRGLKAVSQVGPGRTPAPVVAASPPATHYKDVLDWVGLRVQLIISDEVAMKRCSNFTTDFKDSTRIAYLLVSLGGDKSLFDDVFTAASMMARADVVCKVAASFVSSHPVSGKDPLLPLDIVKGKGAKISKFLFAMHDLYNKVPLVVPRAKLNPRLVAAKIGASDVSGEEETPPPPTAGGAMDNARPVLGAALDEAAYLNPPKIYPGTEGGDGGSGDDLTPRSGTSRSYRDRQRIKDPQFVLWYKELADEDSDVDMDEEEFVRHGGGHKTQVEAAAERLQKRMSMAVQRSQSIVGPSALLSRTNTMSNLQHPTAGNSSHRASVAFGNVETSMSLQELSPGEESQTFKVRSPSKFQTRRSTKKLLDKKDTANRDSKQISTWVASKLALVNNGEVPDVDRLDNTQLLEALIYACSPSSLQSAGKDGFQRTKVIQDNLCRRFNFKKMKIRGQPKPGVPISDETISLKQLLTAMYVLDNETVVAL